MSKQKLFFQCKPCKSSVQVLKVVARPQSCFYVNTRVLHGRHKMYRVRSSRNTLTRLHRKFNGTETRVHWTQAQPVEAETLAAGMGRDASTRLEWSSCECLFTHLYLEQSSSRICRTVCRAGVDTRTLAVGDPLS